MWASWARMFQEHSRQRGRGCLFNMPERTPRRKGSAVQISRSGVWAALPPSPSAPLEPASFVEPARVAQPPRKSEALDTAHRQVPALALAPKASPPSAHS